MTTCMYVMLRDAHILCNTIIQSYVISSSGRHGCPCRAASCIVRPPLLLSLTHAHAARPQASHPRRTPRHEHAHSSLVTKHPNDGASAPSLRLSTLFLPVRLRALFCLSRPYRTVELPPKTPSSHHLGRHPANTHICRPLIETRPAHANRAIRPARQHHR